MIGSTITLQVNGAARTLRVTDWEFLVSREGKQTIKLEGQVLGSLPAVQNPVVAGVATVSNSPDNPFYIPDDQTFEKHPPLPKGYRLLRASERTLRNQPTGVLKYRGYYDEKWSDTSESVSCRRIWYAIRNDLGPVAPVVTKPMASTKRRRPLEM